MMESEWFILIVGFMFILRSFDEVEYSRNVVMFINKRLIYRIYM